MSVDAELLESYFSSYSSEIHNITDLNYSIDKLDEELECVNEKINSIALNNYHLYLEEINFTSNIVKNINEFQEMSNTLAVNMETFCQKSHQYQNSLKDSSLKFNNQEMSLNKCSMISEIIELPILLEESIRRREYENCFSIIEFLKNLDPSRIPIINVIIKQVEVLEIYLETSLCQKLQESISISDCLNIFMNIRRISNLSEEELRVLFLMSQNHRLFPDKYNFKNGNNTMKMDFTQTCHEMIESVDLVKNELFDIVSKYRSLFIDDANSYDGNENENFIDGQYTDRFRVEILKSFLDPINSFDIEVLQPNLKKKLGSSTLSNNPVSSILRSWQLSKVKQIVARIDQDLEIIFQLYSTQSNEIDLLINYKKKFMLRSSGVTFVKLFTHIESYYDKANSLLEMFKRIKFPFIYADSLLSGVFSRRMKESVSIYLANFLENFPKSLEDVDWSLKESSFEESSSREVDALKIPEGAFEFYPLAVLSSYMSNLYNAISIVWPGTETSWLLKKMVFFFTSCSNLLLEAYRSKSEAKNQNWRTMAGRMVNVYVTKLIPFFVEINLEMFQIEKEQFDSSVLFLFEDYTSQSNTHRSLIYQNICLKAAQPLIKSLIWPNLTIPMKKFNIHE